jgi:hypothetical protein
MADQIQIRRDTASNWTSVNPILAQGELGIETDTLKGKVGNGTSAWNSLGYSFMSNTGNLVAGTNVTLGGTLSNRLLGSGNVTINAEGGGVIERQAVNTSSRIDNLALNSDNVGLVVLTGTGNEITGINANGLIRKLVVVNKTGDFVFFTVDSSNSLSENRLDFSLGAGNNIAVEMIYDNVLERWFKIGN